MADINLDPCTCVAGRRDENCPTHGYYAVAETRDHLGKRVERLEYALTLLAADGPAEADRVDRIKSKLGLDTGSAA